METGKTGRYLKYAIGEIILVVIGILIALQINNWNEKNKRRESGYKALVELKSEFESNRGRLDYLITIRQRQEAEFHEHLNLIANDSISLTEKVNSPPLTGYDGDYGETNAALSSLLTSGTLDNIRNDSLRILLASWTSKVDRFKASETRLNEAIFAWKQYKAKTIPQMTAKKRDYRLDWPGDYYAGNMETKIAEQKSKIIESIEYYNLVSEMASRTWIFLHRATALKDDFSKINTLLVQELEAKN